jgi:hypothetical protein
VWRLCGRCFVAATVGPIRLYDGSTNGSRSMVPAGRRMVRVKHDQQFPPRTRPQREASGAEETKTRLGASLQSACALRTA